MRELCNIIYYIIDIKYLYNFLIKYIEYKVMFNLYVLIIHNDINLI